MLIAGLGVSFASMGLGLFFLALRPGTFTTAIPLSRLPEGLARREPAAFLNLGLLSLMVTPMARVAASIVAFAIARDWVFCALTTAVFLLLLFSFILGVG